MSAAVSVPVDVCDFVGDAPKRRRSIRTISDNVFAKVTTETLQMMRGEVEWSKAGPRHFAALYAILHERVYGVAALDLDSKHRAFVASQASRMLEREFEGDSSQLASFVWWVWRREAGREEWRRANGREGSRIGPHFMFSAKLLTDYRKHLHDRAVQRPR